MSYDFGDEPLRHEIGCRKESELSGQHSPHSGAGSSSFTNQSHKLTFFGRSGGTNSKCIRIGISKITDEKMMLSDRAA